MSIHPTASVDPTCELAGGVEIGPACILSGTVKLAKGVRLIGHVYLSGPCTIGEGTIIYPFACIGFPGQDVKFKPGDPTAGVVVGTNGIIREHATIHAATNTHTPTTVGDRIFMMVNSHLGHDATVGNNVVMVNNSAVGGHGKLYDNSTLGGGALVHQFNRVGRFAFVSGGVAVSSDVPPFCIADDRNRLAGLNVIGLRRNGFTREQISALREAFRELLRSSVPKDEIIRTLRERGGSCPPLLELAEFVETAKRPICVGSGRPPRALAAWANNLRRGKIDLTTPADEFEEA
ncbi:MAG: acyl-ACP--UDP-N-acetylglucosamine O-acyltransferase [Phycisphaerales bacterium]